MKKQNAWNAGLIERLKKNPERLLTTTLIGNTLAGLGTASYATFLSADHFGSVGIGIITGVTSFVILMVGEVIPKSLAYNNNVRVAQLAAWPLWISYILLWPISWVLGAVNHGLNRVLGGADVHHVSEEEVLILSRMSAEKGGIGYDEHRLIERVFEFDDIPVGQVMTPLPRAVSLDGDVPVDQIAYAAAQGGHSRYPVFHDDEDNIIGYVHTNALMKALNSDERDKPVSEFILPIQRLDETVSLERAFRALNKKQSHLALVHAHGDKEKILGLVTLEDVLEELVGEIQDETDE